MVLLVRFLLPVVYATFGECPACRRAAGLATTFCVGAYKRYVRISKFLWHTQSFLVPSACMFGTLAVILVVKAISPPGIFVGLARACALGKVTYG